MAEKNKNDHSLVVGETRIRDADGFCGTVVYVGPVASAKKQDEIYAGIVWDDPSRGKHDGSVICRRTNQLVRHFGGCQPTQGSFLRLTKMDTGVTLTGELLRNKYVEMQAPIIAPNNLLPHTARTSSGRDKPIEFLGELKIRGQQQLEHIHKISLRREGISKAFLEDDLPHEILENITDMDLAGNLLCNWEEVLKIIKQFPNLQEFSVAYNRIRDLSPELPTLSGCTSFDRMKVLNLNSCSIGTFQTIQVVGKCMPNLESLCIANANLSDLESMEVEGLENLKRLDCSECQLTSWETQVCKFSKLPLLEQLSINDNPIPSIIIPKADDGAGYFPSLLALQLSGTTIATWNDLEGINSLPVTSLRLQHTPLTSNYGPGEIRFLAVARFPRLEYFNASIITKQERTEAERRYVSMVTNMLLSYKKKNSEEEKEKENTTNMGKSEQLQEPYESQLLVEHPAYPRLREQYKALVMTQEDHSNNMNGNGGLTGSNLASTVCNLTIRSMAASSCSMEPLIRRLPGTLTVGRLKALCARAFDNDGGTMDMDLMTLHFRNSSKDAFPVELDNDDNTLMYYGVCDGAEILMNEIDLEAQRREAERLAEEQERRMAQQEADVAIMQELKQRQQK